MVDDRRLFYSTLDYADTGLLPMLFAHDDLPNLFSKETENGKKDDKS
jgi:hypothetical protein